MLGILDPGARVGRVRSWSQTPPARGRPHDAGGPASRNRGIERTHRAFDGEPGGVGPEDELLERQLPTEIPDCPLAIIGCSDDVAVTRKLTGVVQVGRLGVARVAVPAPVQVVLVQHVFLDVVPPSSCVLAAIERPEALDAEAGGVAPVLSQRVVVCGHEIEIGRRRRQQVTTETRRAPDGGLRLPAHPDWGTRSLERLGRDVQVLDPVVVASERKRPIAPRALEDGEGVVHPASALLVGDAERFELRHPIAGCHAQIETSSRDHVEHSRVLSHPERVVER